MPLFAHPRLTSDAYARAVSRYFHSGIDVPIVIFADPTGREIPGTRLDHVKAQVKGTYLEHAKRALEAFRGGQTPAKAKETWAALGKALRQRRSGKDPGAAVEDMVALRDGAAKGSPMRESLDDLLKRLDTDEASGLVDVAKMDLEGDDPEGAIAALFQVQRDFPGLPSAAKAKGILEGVAKDPARREAFAAAEKEHRGWLALRAADRLARAGKAKEAAEAWARVAKEFEGTPPAEEASKRKP